MSYNRHIVDSVKRRNPVARDSQGLYSGGKHGKSEKAKRQHAKISLKVKDWDELDYIDPEDLG